MSREERRLTKTTALARIALVGVALAVSTMAPVCGGTCSTSEGGCDAYFEVDWAGVGECSPGVTHSCKTGDGSPAAPYGLRVPVGLITHDQGLEGPFYVTISFKAVASTVSVVLLDGVPATTQTCAVAEDRELSTRTYYCTVPDGLTTLKVQCESDCGGFAPHIEVAPLTCEVCTP